MLTSTQGDRNRVGSKNFHFLKFIFRTNDQKSCLDLAISLQLPKVVEALCCRGVDMEAQDSTSCALWDALSSEQHDVADILV